MDAPNRTAVSLSEITVEHHKTVAFVMLGDVAYVHITAPQQLRSLAATLNAHANLWDAELHPNAQNSFLLDD